MKFTTTAYLVAVTSTVVSAFVPSARPSSFVRLTTLEAKKKVFIDGEAGTTGIQVRDRLKDRDDLEIMSAPDELRKDEATRKKLINEADAVILCKSHSERKELRLGSGVSDTLTPSKPVPNTNRPS